MWIIIYEITLETYLLTIALCLYQPCFIATYGLALFSIASLSLTRMVILGQLGSVIAQVPKVPEACKYPAIS